MVVEGDLLTVSATDLEIQIDRSVQVENLAPGRVTASARKLYDLCRGLPDDALLEITVTAGRLTLRSGRSRFVLSTMDPTEFPSLSDGPIATEVRIPSESLKTLIQRTQFAMAQQDVRYYLNGLLLEFQSGFIRAVATDGHRLALADHAFDLILDESLQLILPRKTVQELTRLLESTEEEVLLRLSNNQIQVQIAHLTVTSKLIDGRYPEYERVIPSHSDKQLQTDRIRLRAALSRAAILSNEKFRGVRLHFDGNQLRIMTQNPEQEEAEEELDVDYSGEPLEIGFNVNYLLDALDALSSDEIVMELRNPDASGLLYDPETPKNKYVVMPMRL